MKERSPGIDPRAARRRFERAASSYARASRLEAEVGARMLERLDYVKVAPRRILDAGSGPSREARALRRRYPKAELLALDFALPMLRRRFLEKRIRLCGDMLRLPLADASVDLVWSNMALHWAADAAAALREFERVLAPQGQLMFSTLGPDTLKELRAAAGAARVHAFIDMHDVGDMLVAAGFGAPVMDMEMIEVQYTRDQDLLRDLRASGQTSARADRARGLSGRRFAAGLRAGLAPRATFEVVYGHAWKREQVKTVRVFKRIP
ncbi:MAG: methyltransferase domain-containing protein [Betaproteobacteria bacterium]